MTEPAPPEIVNVEQAAAWNGGQSTSWLDREDQHATAAREHREALLDTAAIAPGEHVLDVGCGTGATTLAAARAAGADGRVVGLDISEPLLARAREHAVSEGLTNVSFVRADAQVAPLGDAVYDVVMSKFGVMFFADPVAAFANFARATRRGGRLAFVSWRDPAENEWIRVLREAAAGGRDVPPPPVGVPGMFGLAERAHATDVLTTAGFTDVVLTPLDVPFVLGPLDDAVGLGSEVGVVRVVLEGLDPAARDAALARIREALAAHDGPDGVAAGSAVWLVAARRL
jgi:SAM-dependent methyltransferase